MSIEGVQVKTWRMDDREEGETDSCVKGAERPNPMNRTGLHEGRARRGEMPVRCGGPKFGW